MKRKLQDFEFYKSNYERPGQQWVCGWNEEPCLIGPDGKGKCRATYTCVPLWREGRWVCTRPKHNGGNCENGPFPDGHCSCPISTCQPQLSLRARRGRLTAFTLAFTFGMVLLLFGGGALEDSRMAIISPGPLNQSHAAQECAQCHISATLSPIYWFSANERESDGALCLQCHANLGKDAWQIHGMPAEWPSKMNPGSDAEGNVASELGWAEVLGIRSPKSDKDLACATCHNEHRGVNADLRAMADAQCQVCHQNPFDSFVEGHPDFNAFPHSRRTRIAFDHGAHIGHFSQAQLDYTCISCHLPDAAGRMLSANFEQSCSSCHTAELEDRSVAEFATLPVVDLAALGDAGLAVGVWPADVDAEDEYEGELTPFTMLLLLGDQDYPDAAADLEIIADLDLLYLGDEDVKALRAVQRMVWGIKRLLYDLSIEGHQTVRKRISRVAGKEIEFHEVAALTARLSEAMLREVIGDWMPQLGDEMRRVEAEGIGWLGLSGGDELAWKGGEAEDEWVSAGGWYYQREYSFSIYYRPTGHADALLRSWLDAAAELGLGASGERILPQLRTHRPSAFCISCHSVDEMGELQGVKINWQGGKGGLASTPAIAHFDHISHRNQACRGCHVFDEELDTSAFAQAYQETDPTVFVGNFSQISKVQCAVCHTESGVGETCVSCHNYHFMRTMH